MRLQGALAYIDPGTGSILIQVIIAGAIGAVAYFRHAIAVVLRKLTGRRPPESQAGPPDRP